MSKNKFFKNKQAKDYTQTGRNNADDAVILDDIEALDDSNGDTEDVENLDVETLEDELMEDVVNADDETVLPEDNVSKELEETKAALEKEKKEYLFLMADFDNYRKRVVKEKADLIKNASEKVLKGILPVVDDFERGLKAAKDSDDVEALRQGMELIFTKLIKFLDENGVKAMDTQDADFDAEVHEAIASVPTGDDSKKGKIIDTTQKGYMLNDKVLRHAKVVVGE